MILIGGEKMAHIKKLEKDKYKVFIEMGKDPATGYRKRQTKIFSRKKDAENWMSQKINAINEGSFINISDITVGDYFLNRWLENHKKPHIAITSYEGYKHTITKHLIPILGKIKLQDLRPDHLESYFNKKRKNGRLDSKKGGLSENSLKKHYVLINEGLKRAVKLKLIKYNPAQAIDSPQPEKYKAPVMKEEEFVKLLEILKEDYFMYVFVKTALKTGMRRSELLGLEWNEVDLKKGFIKVRKTLLKTQGGSIHQNHTKNESSRREIKMSNDLINILKTHKKKQNELKLLLGPEYDNTKNFVFARPDGKNYNPRTISRKFEKAVKKANLPSKYTVHTLRHTFATINLKNGVPAKIVQDMLGHSKISTTLDIYSHTDLDMQKSAVEKLDEIF